MGTATTATDISLKGFIVMRTKNITTETDHHERKGMSDLKMSLMCCESTLISEAPMKEITRDHYALTYAISLKSDEKIDWVKVNRTIIEHRSLSALKYIKNRAWKIVYGKIKP